MNSIVIDNGEYEIKSGLSEDTDPRSTFPSVIGKSTTSQKNEIFKAYAKYSYFGDEIGPNFRFIRVQHLIENGSIQNFSYMEELWNHIFFKELRLDPQSHTICFTESLNRTPYSREKCAQIMFETFQVPGYYASSQTQLGLMAEGLDSGTMVDMGEHIQVSTIYQSHLLPQASVVGRIGGGDLTRHLVKMFTDRGYGFSSRSEREMVRDIKESCCYIPLDFNEATQQYAKYGESAVSALPTFQEAREMAKTSSQLSQKISSLQEIRKQTEKPTYFSQDTLSNDIFSSLLHTMQSRTTVLACQDFTYKLPDKNQIKIQGNEIFRCAEPLFDPYQLGIESPPLPEMIYNSIAKCTNLNYPTNHIVLGGGCSQIPGIENRIYKELSKLCSQSSGGVSSNFVIHNSKANKYSAWNGGAIISSLSTFLDQFAISAEEFDEYGPSIVQVKCI